MTPEHTPSEDHARQVLAELHAADLLDGGRKILARYNERHRLLHADVQRGGALIWAMRQRGMSWRAIYDEIGVVQRTADRWQQIYITEGIRPRPDDELDARVQGLQP